jgi:hypothetical protein
MRMLSSRLHGSLRGHSKTSSNKEWIPNKFIKNP